MKILLSLAAGIAFAFALCAGIFSLIALWLNREKHDQP